MKALLSFLTIFSVSSAFATVCEFTRQPFTQNTKKVVEFNTDGSVILVDKAGNVTQDYALIKLHDAKERAKVAGSKMIAVIATGAEGFMVTAGDVLAVPNVGNYVTIPVTVMSEGKNVVLILSKDYISQDTIRMECTR